MSQPSSVLMVARAEIDVTTFKLSNGGVAAKRSSILSFAISRPTNRNLIWGFPLSLLFMSNHLVEITFIHISFLLFFGNL